MHDYQIEMKHVVCTEMSNFFVQFLIIQSHEIPKIELPKFLQ